MNRGTFFPVNAQFHQAPAEKTGLAVTATLDCDVLIVGGGPIGLLLASLLGEQGVRVVVAERRHLLPDESMAIGVTPPSMAVLKKIGLDTVFTREGLPITVAKVSEGRTTLGRLDFNHLPSDYRFILSIPQSKTVELLWRNLVRYPTVSYWGGVEFLDLETTVAGAQARLRQGDTGIEMRVAAGYVAGCDGHRSQVRQTAGIAVDERQYSQRFVMADFDDSTDLGAEAHLFFTPEASVESFPLPGGRRRWIVLAPADLRGDSLAYHLEKVRALTGYDLSASRHHFLSTFGARRMEVDSYFRGRVVLCGDAAHTMSSIGGQGMNTGFADADLLAVVLQNALRQPDQAPELFAFYDRVRRKAYRVAAARAARGMWLGTHQGRLFSRFRRWFIGRLLFGPRLKDKLAPYFAMLDVPFNDLADAIMAGGPLPPGFQLSAKVALNQTADSHLCP